MCRNGQKGTKDRVVTQFSTKLAIVLFAEYLPLLFFLIFFTELRHPFRLLLGSPPDALWQLSGTRRSVRGWNRKNAAASRIVNTSEFSIWSSATKNPAEFRRTLLFQIYSFVCTKSVAARSKEVSCRIAPQPYVVERLYLRRAALNLWARERYCSDATRGSG